MLLPYKKFSPKELKKALATLLECNPPLHEFHAQLKANIRLQEGNPFKRYPFSKFRQEFFQILPFHRTFRCPMVMHGVEVPKEVVTKAQIVKDMEVRFLAAFVNLIYKLANRWQRRSEGGVYIEFDDLENEGYVGLSNAIFGFNRPDIKFMTYFHHAISNQMGVAINKARYNFPWPRSLRKLFSRYEEACRKSPGLNFDEIVERLKFTDEQCQQVLTGMIAIIPASSIQGDLTILSRQGTMKSDENDYTAESVKNTHYRPAERLEPDQKEAIAAANLNEWEQAVLEGFLSGHWGWKSEVAKRFGKSRMMPIHTLRAVKEKILKQMEEKEQLEAA